MRPLIVSALAALQIVLDTERKYVRREIIGILENDPAMRKSEEPQRWTGLAKTFDEEWSIFDIRTATRTEGLEYNEFRILSGDGDQSDMIVTDITNALSHADALLNGMGYATNIL